MMDEDGKPTKNNRNVLKNLYEQYQVPLSDQEENSLTPILNTLKAPAARYGSTDFMAEGGEKRVFRVYDQYLNRHVAMAQAPASDVNTDQERFLREGQLTANLTHPNIVPIHNMGIGADGIPFFTMELIQGDSLGDIIDHLGKRDSTYTDRYKPKALLSIFNKICDAAAYAHSRNVIHLDIKPDNIRIGQFGEVFLCDWGLAIVDGHIENGEAEPGQLDGDLLNDMTLMGTVKGTPGFMAPEQILNREKNNKSDIFALGAILYYMITYQLPFDGKSALERMQQTRDGKLVPVRKRKTKHAIPSGLAAIAMKALSHQPDARYERVQALQDDVNRFLAGYPTEAERPNILSRTFMLILRHRNPSIWLLTSLMLLSVVMGVYNKIVTQEKQMAETNLALFLEEQGKSDAMANELTDMSEISQSFDRFSRAGSTLELTKIALKQNDDPDIQKALLINKANLHFLLQQFNQAAETFWQLPELDEKNRKLQKLCREFGRIKPDDNSFLSDSDLAQLLVRNQTVLWGHAMYLYYHYPKANIDPREHIQVAGAMLARLNEIRAYQIPDLKLVERPEGYHLDMSHTPYSIYLIKLPSTQRINVLKYLQLHSLDISHTPISLAYELRGGLKLEKLRMVGTLVEPANMLDNIFKKMELKEVTLGKGDYPDSVIAEIEAIGINVIEEEY